MTLGDPRWLQMFWLVPFIAFALARSAWRRRLARGCFAEQILQPRVYESIRPIARWIKAVFILSSLALTTLALTRPLGAPIPTPIVNSGRDVVFLLDVSRSMLSEDLAPNRLERAKLMIADTLRALQGDRVALVVFAGTTVVKSPLTTDYGFVRLALDELQPDAVSRGGTLIGDAIRKSLAELVPEQPDGRDRDFVLISDGEDQESFPVEAAADAGAQGVRIITIGLGDAGAGSPIPIEDDRGRRTYIEYQGETVRSRLNETTLRDIATATPGGIYLPVRREAIHLDEVYTNLVRRRDADKEKSEQSSRRREYFQWLLGFAFGLLLLESLISERRRS